TTRWASVGNAYSRDVLQGQAGNDYLLGGLGADTYIFDADTWLGNDTIDDIGGIDTLDFSTTTPSPVRVNLGVTSSQNVGNLSLTLTSASAIENVFGGQLADSLMGNARDNVLVGNDGNDWLGGGAGSDSLYGGTGNDWLEAGSAAELAEGGP